MHTPHYNQLQEASRILRNEIKQPKIERTVDMYPTLAATQRQILFEVSKFSIPRLLEKNPR